MTLTEPCALPGLEFVGDTLYGACSYDPESAPYLVTVDPDTGVVNDVGYTYADDLIEGLAYEESSGIMYGLQRGRDYPYYYPNELYTIDLDDGEAHFLCDVIGADYGYYEYDLRSIEFGPDGMLYGGEYGDSYLVRIDTTPADGYCYMHRIGDTAFSVTGLTLIEGSDPVCPLGDITPGETATFSIFAQVKPYTLGIVSNEVEVSSDNDPNPGNDWDTEANLVLGKADLRVRKYGKPDGVVEAGDELIYTVIVDNLGPGYAHDVVLRDLMSSSDWTYDIDYIDSDRPADCWSEWWGYEDEMRITCRLNDPLEVISPSSSGRWVVKVYVDVYEEQSINNVAQLVASDWDPDPSNNEAIVEHEVEPVADLRLYKTAWGEIPDGCDQPPYPEQQNRVAAGGMLTYELEVCNEGPSTAENVVLEDWGITPLLDITDVHWDYGVSCLTVDLGERGDTNRRLTCYLGSLDYYYDYEGSRCKSVYIEGRLPSDVPEGTRLVNDAKAYGEVYDDQNWNNFATDWTTVETWADLMVEKTQEPEIALPGQDITYSIVVTNRGPSDAKGVLISDTIPVQVLNPTWTCCASDSGQCDVPCEVPVCPPGQCPWPDIGLFAQADIPADEWTIYTVEGTLDWWPCGPFTNTVELVPPQSQLYPDVDIDFCDENNVAEAVNDPVCHFDPLVLKVYPGPDSPP